MSLASRAKPRKPVSLTISEGLELSELPRHLLRAQEEERRRISRESHDGASQLLAKLDDGSRNGEAEGLGHASELTPRELEVIKMLAEGCSVRQVASRLGLAAKTVEAHKFNLMRKLDIHNKAQLVTYAIQRKILKIPAVL